VPAALSFASALGLRMLLRPVRPDIFVVILTTVIVYGVFLGAVMLSGLEADDRLIAAAIWSRVRGFFPGAQAGAA
jgi:hypothetical protein